MQEQEKRHQQELATAGRQGALEKNALTAEAKKKEADILDKARVEAARIVEDMKASIRVEAEQVRKGSDSGNDTAGAVDLRKDSGEAGFMKGTKIRSDFIMSISGSFASICLSLGAGAEEARGLRGCYFGESSIR